MKKSTLALMLLAAPLGAHAQFATDLKSSEVVPGIHMIEGADGFGGGNVALLTGDERIVLIDDFIEPLSGKLIEIASGIAGSPVDFVINTHVHGDHTGGNAVLAGEGATIVAHDNIRTRMLAAEDVNAASLPVITFSDTMTFHLNGTSVYVFHVETAHTDGDAIIQFPDVNVIHTGDVWFNGLFPFIDLDSGGTVDGYIAAQKRIIAMAGKDTKIIPGHGPLGDREGLQRTVDMIIAAQAKVKALVDSGLSADEIVAENALAEFEPWSWNFITTERMTRTLFRDLTE
ncbi:MAG: MBL fold metallo-hydrolase [Pseudomonadota bacterium]